MANSKLELKSNTLVSLKAKGGGGKMGGMHPSDSRLSN